MFIRDLLNQGRVTVSCELFPPKLDEDIEKAEEIVRRTVALSPDFISVTYGASGGTSKNTLRMVEYALSLGVPGLAHLTCVAHTKSEIGERLALFREHGIENVLALRGDIPENADFPTPHNYRYAVELVREVNAFGGFCIGGACYPEGHVESANMAEDLAHVKEKVDAGCEFLTTQMYFDNNVFFRFLNRARSVGIHVPILAGIMPVTNKKQIRRMVKLSGTNLTPRLLSILDRFGEDDAAMRQAGIDYATDQIIDLVANGVKGIHIYALNKPDIAQSIIGNISHIIKVV